MRRWCRAARRIVEKAYPDFPEIAEKAAAKLCLHGRATIVIADPDA
jgi:hypothetical protein